MPTKRKYVCTDCWSERAQSLEDSFRMVCAECGSSHLIGLGNLQQKYVEREKQKARQAGAEAERERILKEVGKDERLTLQTYKTSFPGFDKLQHKFIKKIYDEIKRIVKGLNPPELSPEGKGEDDEN